MSTPGNNENINNNYSSSNKNNLEPKKCFICGKSSKEFFYNDNFSECEHYYCIYCLFRSIFINNIKEFIDQNEIIVNCKCKTGKKKLSLKEIEKIINYKSKIDEQQTERITHFCNNHESECELFCKDCEKYICFHCKNEEEHKNHKIVLASIYVRMYKEFIKGMPLKYKYTENFKLNLDESVDKFSKELAEKTNSVIKGINQLIDELNEIKNNYLISLLKIQKNGLESINLMELFYYEYYQDLLNMNNDNDIFSLRYLAHFKYEMENFNMIYNMGIFNKLEDIQGQITNLKNLTENPYSIKVNYVEIPTTFREITRTLGHEGPINCLTKIGDNQFISGSSDNSIKFWNLDDEELKPYDCIDKYTGNVGLVLLLNDNRLCSSSATETWIKIYEKIKTFYENDEQMNSNYQYNVSVSLSEHKKIVSAIIELDNNLLVTAARDGYIILWETIKKVIKQYDSIHVCKDGIYSLCKLKDNKFASGSADGTIHLWKYYETNIKEGNNKYNSYQILRGHKNKVRCIILLNNNDLCSGDDDGIIIIWKKSKIEKYEKDWIKQIKDELITCMTQLTHGYLITGSYNPKHSSKVYLRVWESNDNGYEEKEKSEKHYKPINSVIELDWGNIVSAGDDGVIIIWKSGVLVD